MKRSIKLFHWLPRVICIIAILFVSLFALDAFTPGLTIRQQLSALFMHLIPSFILLALLIVAWKWELIGGIILAVTGLIASPLIFMLNHGRNHLSVGASLGVVLVITFPFILAGALFMISDHLKKTNLANV